MKVLVQKTPQGRGNRSYPSVLSTFLSKFQQFFQSRRLLPRALNLGIRDPSRSALASEWSFIFLELARMMLSTLHPQVQPRVGATGLSEFIMRSQKYE